MRMIFVTSRLTIQPVSRRHHDGAVEPRLVWLGRVEGRDRAVDGGDRVAQVGPGGGSQVGAVLQLYRLPWGCVYDYFRVVAGWRYAFKHWQRHAHADRVVVRFRQIEIAATGYRQAIRISESCDAVGAIGAARDPRLPGDGQPTVKQWPFPRTVGVSRVAVGIRPSKLGI